MQNASVRANGGAMPKIKPADSMRRARSIFRATYKFPLIKFAAIGRNCFAWALKKAWAEAREAARVAAIPAAPKKTRIDGLQASIARAFYNESWTQARNEIGAAGAEIALLSA